MHGFRYYFTPLAGVLFTLRSRYWCAIGRQLVLSLTGWSPQIHAGFHVTGGTWEAIETGLCISPTGLSPSVAGLSRPFGYARLCNCPAAPSRSRNRSRYPGYATPTGLTHIRFGLFPFRSPLLRKSIFFPFPRVLRCFSSPRSPPHPMDSDTADRA